MKYFAEEVLLHWFLDDVWLDSHSAKSRHVVKFSSASLPICFFFAFKRLIVPKSLALNFYKQLWIAIWKLSIDDWCGPNEGNERNLDSKSYIKDIKDILKKGHKNLKKSPTLFCCYYVSNFKRRWEIFSNFVTFSHYLNFNKLIKIRIL